MHANDTAEVGTVYTLEHDEADAPIDLGPVVTLDCGTRTGAYRYRAWYVQGNGVLGFSDYLPDGLPASERTSLEACERWLAANGYRPRGEMPPDCFEYVQREPLVGQRV